MIPAPHVIEVTYIIAVVLFILSLKWLSSPATARHGVWAGEVGMLLAIVGTLLYHGIVDYKWIAIALGAGRDHRRSARQRPDDRRAAANCAQPCLRRAVRDPGRHGRVLSAQRRNVPPFMMSVLSLEVILGGLTFTGSLMAAGKLQEILPQRPITYKGQNFVNLGMLAIAIGIAVMLVLDPEAMHLYPIMVGIALIFGVMMIVPIGGADMPTVISLLNSYAGLSAAAMGFVLNSKLLIVAGSLDGASGFILSVNMSKAMNRSFTNVLFGAFGQVQTAAAGAVETRTVRSATPEEAAAILVGREQGRHRSRLRNGGGAGAAQSSRTL